VRVPGAAERFVSFIRLFYGPWPYTRAAHSRSASGQHLEML
jgi:hypothetical protein